MVLDASVYRNPTHLDLRGTVNVGSRSGAMDLRDPADDRIWQGNQRHGRTPREFRKYEISSRQQIEKATVSCTDISRGE